MIEHVSFNVQIQNSNKTRNEFHLNYEADQSAKHFLN